MLVTIVLTISKKSVPYQWNVTLTALFYFLKKEMFKSGNVLLVRETSILKYYLLTNQMFYIHSFWEENCVAFSISSF